MTQHDAHSRLHPPDELVVQRVLAGDTAMFELLMRRYNQRTFRVVRSMLNSDNEAEDVAQDAFVRAFEKLEQFEGRSSFATWLTRIAVHEASARRRLSRRMEPLHDESAHMHRAAARDRSPSHQDAADMRELNTILTRAVESLPDDLRSVFVLRVVEDLDTHETAACLDLSESNVKVRLHRARLYLQRSIDGAIGSEIRKLYQFDGERCDRMVRAVLCRIAGRS